MRAVIHWVFAVVLLATISCSVAHADVQLPAAQMPDCPHHQPDNPKPNNPNQPDDAAGVPPHCQDCIQGHFLTESRASLGDSIVPLLPAVPAAALIAPETATLWEPVAVIVEPVFLRDRILRI